ncbi:hypothetical protein HPB50_008299 [Hyalomma asiaticum]|uniref:Uncharacterized protein n=1 Tax=Hyalomma asiaticum TaxID=266040 RepID=A0ACB7SSW2_HYAAI|nr:hypothetical protein HPB50_008299 [Hyalomma asiaticum]
MGRRLNLSHLSQEECERILAVIQRDLELRAREKERLGSSSPTAPLLLCRSGRGNSQWGPRVTTTPVDLAADDNDIKERDEENLPETCLFCAASVVWHCARAPGGCGDWKEGPRGCGRSCAVYGAARGQPLARRSSSPTDVRPSHRRAGEVQVPPPRPRRREKPSKRRRSVGSAAPRCPTGQ